MSVTAKVKCGEKSLINMGSLYEVVKLRFIGDYDDDRNREWSVATPVLNIEMHVKPKVGELFEHGGAYTLTFTPEAE